MYDPPPDVRSSCFGPTAELTERGTQSPLGHEYLETGLHRGSYIYREISTTLELFIQTWSIYCVH